MVRQTNVDMAYSIFIPLRVGFNQFCVPPYHVNYSEVKICMDAEPTGAGLTVVDTTGGDTDDFL